MGVFRKLQALDKKLKISWKLKIIFLFYTLLSWFFLFLPKIINFTRSFFTDLFGNLTKSVVWFKAVPMLLNETSDWKIPHTFWYHRNNFDLLNEFKHLTNKISVTCDKKSLNFKTETLNTISTLSIMHNTRLNWE